MKKLMAVSLLIPLALFGAEVYPAFAAPGHSNSSIHSSSSGSTSHSESSVHTDSTTNTSVDTTEQTTNGKQQGLENASSHVPAGKHSFSVLEALMTGQSLSTVSAAVYGVQSDASTPERVHGLQGLQNAFSHIPTNSHAYSVLQALISGQNPSTVTQDVYQQTTDALNTLENDTQDGAQVKKYTFDTLAQTFQLDGQLTPALQAANDSVAVDPTDTSAFQQLTDLYNQAGDTSLKIYTNGKQLKSELKPLIQEGRTLIPLRAIAESLGATVNWNDQTRIITITKGDTTITLPLDGSQATVNGTPVTLDVPANSYKGSTFVPARFVSEGLGQVVKWIPGGIVNIFSTNETTTTSTTSNTDSNTTEQP